MTSYSNGVIILQFISFEIAKKYSYSVNTTLETFILFGVLMKYLKITVLVCNFELFTCTSYKFC